MFLYVVLYLIVVLLVCCVVLIVVLYIIIIIITSTSDLQPSTPTANQLPGQLVSTEIRTMYKYINFKSPS